MEVMDWQEASRIAIEWAAAQPRLKVVAQQTRTGEWAVVVSMPEGFDLYCLTVRAARRLFARWARIRTALSDAGGWEQRPLGLEQGGDAARRKG